MKKEFLFKAKKKFINCLVVAIGLFGAGGRAAAQDNGIEAIVHRVASAIISNTSYQFMDAATKKLYSSTQGLPAGAVIRARSLYNKWEYANGVMMIGMLQAAKGFKEESYKDYVFKNFDFIFENAGYFKSHYALRSIPAWGRFFRMGALDDCGAMAAALANVNEDAKNEQYKAYLEKTADYILNRQLRLDDGTLCRNNPHNRTIWADDLYMSVPFLARMGKLTGDNKYFDDAIKQVLNFNKYLYDPAKGIYFHCWYSDVAQNGVAHWLRCNGWIAMAQVELLSNLPKSYPGRQQLITYLQRQLTGISRYQDQSGLWHQLIDKPDSYLETSGTAMFVYAIAKAVNEHWISSSYKSVAIEGWKGLAKKVTPDGRVEDVCVGTGIEDDILFYYKRPKVLNDFHVAGPILLAATEMMKLVKGGAGH